MSPQCKVVYFPIKGLAEPIRFLLSYGKTDFDDVRCNPEDWPALKPSTPLGQLPLIEIEGKKVNQSLAICRYLGKKFGIGGNNDWEELLVDVAVETIIDLRTKIANYAYESNEETKAKKKETLMKETIPFYLSKLEESASNNKGYLACGKLTWADIYFTSILEYFNGKMEYNLISGFSKLCALRKTVTELPGIKEWVEKYPLTHP